MPDQTHRHAVVIGGSIAGLLTARVLSEHFQKVTIVERDTYPAGGPAHRRGVPQSPHLHILLMRGQAIFEDLFPGLKQELIAAGAPQIDSGQDLLWRTPFGWGVRYKSGMTKLAFTRDLLDWCVRQRIQRIANIEFRAASAVLGLSMAADGRGAAGVRLADGELPGDLIVDASGRGSQMPSWLAEVGFPRPQESIVNSHRGYASRLFRQPAGAGRDWRAVAIQAAPPHQPRVGVLFPVEGDRWLVSLAGADGEYPGTDDEGFLAFAGKLSSPILHDAIRDAEPLSPIATSRSAENRLRRYDKLERWPERLLVMGDAACAFNPVYGQGMTVAALQANALAQLLSEGTSLANLGKCFQQHVARIVAMPWAITTSEDSRYRGTTGAILDGRTRVMHRYMDAVLQMSTERLAVRHTMLQVQHMLLPATSLFAPPVLLPSLQRLAIRKSPSQTSASFAAVPSLVQEVEALP